MIFFAPLFILFPFISLADSSISLDDLLKEIKNEHHIQSVENKKREQEFATKKSQQEKLLQEAVLELKKQEEITTQLEKQFEDNEKSLTKIEKQLNIAMGTMGELFGVVRQVSEDLKGTLQTSIVSAEIPGREKKVESLAKTKVLPKIQDLEHLWFEIQREMTESSKVSQFRRKIVFPNGQQEENIITRIGTFNLVSKNSYLTYQHETGQVIQLARQPSGRSTSFIKSLKKSSRQPYYPFFIDPSRGSILSTITQSANFIERIQQGGIIGYIIIFLLFVGLMMAWERTVYLQKENKRIKQQLESSSPNSNNSLGRLLQIFDNDKTLNKETLELKMEEAILKNISPIEKGIGSIKVLATIAPLLGLLGTVTGMIGTFQTITLFGAGDPKLMAGGISQALMTTALGLTCAIPLLLLHNILSTKSRQIIQILEKHTLGIIAEKMDPKNV